jgi:hypothetical protein
VARVAILQVDINVFTSSPSVSSILFSLATARGGGSEEREEEGVGKGGGGDKDEQEEGFVTEVGEGCERGTGEWRPGCLLRLVLFPYRRGGQRRSPTCEKWLGTCAKVEHVRVASLWLGWGIPSDPAIM